MTTRSERNTAWAERTGGALREEEIGGTPSEGRGTGAEVVAGGVRELLAAMPPELAQAACQARPPLGSTGTREPDALQCLRCQLLGRRRLTCSRRELCLEVPHFYPLGPILLLAWLATAAAFVVSIW